MPESINNHNHWIWQDNKTPIKVQSAKYKKSNTKTRMLARTQAKTSQFANGHTRQQAIQGGPERMQHLRSLISSPSSAKCHCFLFRWLEHSFSNKMLP